MIGAGIDIGSRTIKLVVIENNEIVVQRKAATTFDPLSVCDGLLDDIEYDTITATGYGRHLFNNYKNCEVISELKAFALGASYLDPACRTILDIGGQDIKAISLGDSGNMLKFEMNDKCAAGTGRFLEIMASALGYRYEEFASEAADAPRAEPINNMCTVFAESEVISLVTKGIPRNEIALGIHRSITSRAVNLLKRVAVKERLMFAGGVAFNLCVQDLVSEELSMDIVVAKDPQLVGALGSALNSIQK